ncbi:thioredoxin family protein [Streptococcus parasanguinis]|jgi:small redox-active disulfide protein 2|uniref:Putative redox-active disulfide protein 2 n=1 Tax=Streptococcus parasanguinis (strain ATCC 15912 / DSM 6778 / CIP 104372 / LMG 14537) TaxID=760570 RepID=F8DHS7_STREP|nr:MULTISPECIES: thioredoxin family protein [Streptococcus]HEM3651267.1 thioredoxin family protein [Streptococcus suis]AEH56848.1 putative redox-active disulfide protein 2 [Streptococcus parasanguinis ATCC 15912]SUN83828.1 redox-active disulfide protein 2 [Streptococcus parasanguinis]HEM3659676.1 thioredoxin family protein [Streptococcus suis]HEM3674052.1 thioredoxin family protein [Streptococcus suis]
MSQDLSNQIIFKILGSGCKKCNLLEEHVRQACKDEGLDVIIEHEKDFSKIAEYGVMSTPALVLNEKVVSTGKVLTVDDVKKLFMTPLND